ncbi:MAG: nucleoside hydrolase [Oscillospiraceae bacterium]|nr:nucleoside hydrolase [Oscillospiraceae bacterium]
MSDKRKVIIDCDTGVDDALALLLCLKNLDVVGITTVGGNVRLENTQRNTRYVTEVAGRIDVPVYAGYARPLLVPLQDASYVHGVNGLGSVQVPEPSKPLEKQHAVDFLIETFMAREDVSLITLGPLTNIAHALLKEPRLAQRIPEILTMGGSTTWGNATPAAEFNIFVDPEAAKLVFESGIPIRMVGLNLTRQQRASQEVLDQIQAMDSPAARLAAQLFLRQDGKVGQNNFCDACAVMWWIDPGVITKSAMMHVVVETQGEYTRGMTLCDGRGFQANRREVDMEHEKLYEPLPKGLEPNVEVALELDQARFSQVLLDTMRRYSEG